MRSLPSAQILESRQAVRPQHDRLAIDREALGLDPPGSSRDDWQSHGPVIGVASVEPDCGTFPAYNQTVAVMLDFVDQSAPDGGFEALIGWAGMTNPAGRRLILIT